MVYTITILEIKFGPFSPDTFCLIEKITFLFSRFNFEQEQLLVTDKS